MKEDKKLIHKILPLVEYKGELFPAMCDTDGYETLKDCRCEEYIEQMKEMLKVSMARKRKEKALESQNKELKKVALCWDCGRRPCNCCERQVISAERKE